jgi:hypothetical protein
MGGKGSGRGEWSDEDKAARVKPEAERRKPKTVSLYLEELVELRRASTALNITESDYIRGLIKRDNAETISKIALQLKSHYDIQEKNIEMMENTLDEMIREQENLTKTLKKLGLTVDK